MANSRLPDGLPSGVRVCVVCSHHQSNNSAGWKRRDQDHQGLWADDAHARAERYTADLAAAHAATEAVRQELVDEVAKRPNHIVYQNLDQQTVWEAEADRDAAYNSRDRAFRVLSEVWILHRDAGSGRCRCGLPYRSCKTAEILEQYRGLDGWERKHLERMRKGLPHSLPRNHPAVIDPRWRSADEQEDQHEAG